MEHGFVTIAATLLVAAIIGTVAVRLRQPLIVSFIAVGIIVGPAGLGWVQHEGAVELLATIGISVLLFLVGLKLDVEVIRSMGRVALATGLGQVLFTSVVGFLLCQALGLSIVGSLYVAVALTFSSTIIIVKLLSDKSEIDSLHGRIAVGFLIVQDLMVILAMIVLSAIGPAGDGVERAGVWREAGLIVLKGVGLLVCVGVMMRFVLPRMMHLVARSQELLILFATAWAVGLAAMGELAGFSREVGAFLAGVSLASTPYRETIGGRLVSLRDFLLLFFFLGLGASLDLRQIGGQVVPAVLLSLFVLIGNPIIVMAIMGYMGYRRRTGFLAGLTVAQISEFSLILGALGVSLGHIGGDEMGLVTLVGLITIGLSTYMILYSHPLYERLSPFLGVFERRVPHRELGEQESPGQRYDVLVFGLGRYGHHLSRGLIERGVRVLGVDFDPQAVTEWRREGFSAQYGDAEDPEFPTEVPLDGVRWVVSTMPERTVNLALMHSLRERGYPGSIALTARSRRDAEILSREKPDLILKPFEDAAARAAEQLVKVIKPRDS
jgi:Kef-type K+ transport system membrane component KefB